MELPQHRGGPPRASPAPRPRPTRPWRLSTAHGCGRCRRPRRRLSNYAHDLDRLASLQSARDQSAKAQTLAQARFNAGYVGSLDLIDAERTLADAETALAQAQAAVSDDQVALFLALGGGWRTTA